ncbi:hypothetical protein [Shewanella algae]|jgi:hypothetical protein|uniref:hypothetical protein n=1 Tax=Shewanella algae TaxID=38313 RepID=UPI0006CFF2E5|nr:hypothetical protein [Shewanella algae]AYV15254.1 hypothetical protein EEY24_21725 [Shewanella algae]MBO2554094.1 hypothetical protein [Shewanella algae]MBO2562603.1 hypothetical protein [Shewanella algae]MBO2566806.1 hypothetical protein [Shewanella algae]MBO2584041.1 hypothetical protein [Shewanella algae]
MKVEQRSRKAREVHAETLIKISTNLLTAFGVTILILPLSGLAGIAIKSGDTAELWDLFLKLFGSWYGVVVIALELLIGYIVFSFRDRALDVYDELYPDACASEVVKETITTPDINPPKTTPKAGEQA